VTVPNDTVVIYAAATRSAAVQLGRSALARVYAPDLLAGVLSAVAIGIAGAGSLEAAAERIDADEWVQKLPTDARAEVVAECVRLLFDELEGP
jgi:hypothetical protein